MTTTPTSPAEDLAAEVTAELAEALAAAPRGGLRRRIWRRNLRVYATELDTLSRALAGLGYAELAERTRARAVALTRLADEDAAARSS